MPYIIKHGDLRQFLERDSFGGPMRWGALKHATTFTKATAARITKGLQSFEPGARVVYVATTKETK